MATTTAPRRRLVVARVAGIDIRVHPTFLLLVALVAVGGFGPPVDGAVWVALLFGSVTAHELAHSLVARRRGVPVKDILLLPIGGISELERLPDRPADELAVAVAGPLTSIAISVAALGVAALWGTALLPVDIVEGPLVVRIGWGNALLAAFNLLPAFPMDGGRVLRALMARRVGLEVATRRAGAIGRQLAIVMGAVGILVEPWLLVIAAFVYFGARAEELATMVHLRLGGLRVADVMIEPSLTVAADTPARELEQLRRRITERHLPVVDGAGRYLGMVDLGLDVPRGAVALAASDVVDRDAPALAVDSPLEEALRDLGPRPSPLLAVVDGAGRLVGLVVRDDVARLMGPAA